MSDDVQDASGVQAALAAIRARILAACKRSGRNPAAVKLVAVSKLQPTEKIRAAIAAGQLLFGENYAQELRDKADELRADLGSLASPEWHFLGALQTNKVKYVVGRASLVHTVDRLELAEAIAKRAAAAGLIQRVLLEVNVGEEPQKAGARPAELPGLLEAIAALPSLRLEGLMCIPPAGVEAKRHFARLRELRDENRAGTELSMGMSDDFEAAIEEGATLVRVGTAIFGARPGK